MDCREKTAQFVMNTYRRYPVTIVRGDGSLVFDEQGREYLDFIAGIAVCSLGHSPKLLQDVLARQSATLVHTSNLFYTEPQADLAEFLAGCVTGATAHALSTHREGWKTFYCNSGAEANEAAIKLARTYHAKKGRNNRYEIITFFNSFHGRTFGALSATAQERFHKSFEPMLPGFKYLPFNDMETFRASVTDETGAVMIETIQAEGGVNECREAFLRCIRDVCRDRGILLIMDEVQTGLGRTGRFFSYEHFGVEPDIFTLAKGIAGGLPMGAMLARGGVADAFEPGAHASTFGGNPLAAAAALAVCRTIAEPAFLASVAEKGEALRAGLENMKGTLPIANVRGKGLLVGVTLAMDDASSVVPAAMGEGLLINVTAGNVVRLVPPLTVTADEIARFLEIFGKVLKQF